MKDRLGRSRFINIAPHNPTQTVLSRFNRTPKSALHTGWTDAVDRYEKSKKLVMRTSVTNIFDGD